MKTNKTATPTPTPIPLPPFNWKELQERRQILKTTGWLLVALSVIMLFVDEARFPIFTTLSIGIIMAGAGLSALYFAYRLPLVEAKRYAFECGRPIAAPDLVQQMRVSIHTAELILDTLLAKGFLRQVDTEHFETIR